MTQICFIGLLLVAQSMSCSGAVVKSKVDAGTSFRVQSNSSQFSLFNNAFANRIQHEIEMKKAEPVKSNKLVWVILAMMFGCCGCDRCYMGQILLGTCKGLTFGGFFIWWAVDYWVCAINALQKSEAVDSVGYNNVFEKSSIDSAFYVAIVLLILQLVTNIRSGRNFSAQLALQRELMEQLNSPKDSSAAYEIPHRHQSLAYIPTALTAGLRKANLVSDNPTMPELLFLFKSMDKDGDGKLDREELKKGLSAMGISDESADAMIKSADTDGDGKISKDEWLASYAEANQGK